MSLVVAVRDASADDLDAIAAIESSCFPAAPWPRETFADELSRPHAHALVAMASAEVLGFACTWHVVGEAHLLRIAVRPAVQRAGIGRALLARVIADARAAGCAHVDLEVARGNAAAVAFYRAVGFVEIGARKHYYRAPPDDALLLRLSLTPPPVDGGAAVV
jgi:ribosomal-protein-alanine acetyltransferase